MKQEQSNLSEQKQKKINGQLNQKIQLFAQSLSDFKQQLILKRSSFIHEKYELQSNQTCNNTQKQLKSLMRRICFQIWEIYIFSIELYETNRIFFNTNHYDKTFRKTFQDYQLEIYAIIVKYKQAQNQFQQKNDGETKTKSSTLDSSMFQNAKQEPLGEKRQISKDINSKDMKFQNKKKGNLKSLQKQWRFSEGQLDKILQKINNPVNILHFQFITDLYYYILLRFFRGLLNSERQIIQLNLRNKLNQYKDHARTGDNIQKVEQFQQQNEEKKVIRYLKKKFQYASYDHLQINQNTNPTLLLNRFIKIIACQKKIWDLNLQTYFHELHKLAQKKKNFLLSSISKTKCFKCEAESYSSGSIHKLKIYQCLTRKISNATGFFQFDSQ